MKISFVHGVYKILAVGAVGALFIAAYFVNPSFLKAPHAESATTDNVSGWTWSENVGWFSFNCTDMNTCATSPYGVKVDTTTKAIGGPGAITGNAWGENIGWVSFDRAKTGNPPSAPYSVGGPIAYVDWSTGKVTGWMRVLSGCQNNRVDGLGNCTGSGAGDFAGGWDGWIKLSDDSLPLWTGYGVKILTNKFSGYGWGGDVVGWVDFSPTISGVDVGPRVGVPPCTASDPSIIWGPCTQTGSCPVDLGSTAGIKVGVCSSGVSATASCDNAPSLVCTSPAPQPGPTCFRGISDGICESAKGETPLNCPSDCRVKYKQF